MKRTLLGRSLALLSLAFAIVLLSAAVALASTVRGTIRDDYLSTPLSGIQVTLIQSGSDSVIETETSGETGVYEFSEVPAGSYRLYFSDPDGTYYPQWYDYMDTYDDADSIVVDATGTVTADAWLDAVHVKLQTVFTTATVTAESSVTPLVGDTVSIVTTATDALWHYAAADRRVQVQTSTNGSSWTYTAEAEDNWDGTYSYTFSPTTEQVRYVRFHVPSASDLVETSSPSVRIAPKRRECSWQGATLEGTSTARVSAVAGQSMRIRGRLLDAKGVPMLGNAVLLQVSEDGAAWHDSAFPAVATTVTGEYCATITVGVWTHYRFAYVSASGYDAPAHSSTFSVDMPWRFQPGVTVKRSSRYLYLGGSVTPIMPAKARVVFTVQQRKGGRWRAYKTYYVAPAYGTLASHVFKRVKLPRGSFRWKASISANANHAAYDSGYRTFRM